MSNNAKSSINKSPTLVGFGEAMIRFKPINDDQDEFKPSCASKYLRSVGGDELNVCVNFSRMGGERTSSWVSAVPQSPHPISDVIRKCASKNNVDLTHLYSSTKLNAEVGTFTMLPKEKRVHYRRRSSAFWTDQPVSYDWSKIFNGVNDNGAWVHATGITPLCGSDAESRWSEHLQVAAAMNIPVSIDFNHRSVLGSIEKLWRIVLPRITELGENLKFLVVSLKSLRLLSKIVQVSNVPEPSNFELIGTPTESKVGTTVDDPCWMELLSNFRNKMIETKVVHPNVAIATCFKKRNSQGIQTRWSAVAHSTGVHTTMNIPTIHVPKDECGGGSAWAAGCIDGLIRFPNDKWIDILRRGDVSAAFCQEIIGDHSNTPGVAIDQCLLTYNNRPALIGNVATADVGRTDKDERMENTIKRMGDGRVVAILRAKNADLAIARAIELVTELNATVIEVTTDTEDYLRVLSTLCTLLGDKALIGVGTIMHATDIKKIAELGATFALSPVNPVGFVEECLKFGVVPVPAAYTPTEVWTAYQQGAKIVKLFPAHMWDPKVLKAMLGTGELGGIKICPSGGISPETAPAWLDAGAFSVGMGSNLTGKDVKISTNDVDYEEKVQIATDHWNTVGKEAARKCIADLRDYVIKK